MKISKFFATKNGIVEPACEQFNKWKGVGITVKILHMNNAGGNKKMQQRCEIKDWKLNIACEYTTRDTPHHNAIAELAFPSIANKGRVMMAAANLPIE